MPAFVLAATDSPDKQESIKAVFEFIEVDVHLACDLASTREILDPNNDYLIAIVDLKDDVAQKEIIDLINQKIPALHVYLLKRQGTQQTSDDNTSLPKGATGLLEYPFQYRNLLGIIRQAEMEQKGSKKSTSYTLTGQSPQLKEIQSLIRHVSITEANVLILGESGTGKEVVARGIHNLSLRNDKPFVAVNCGAIPPELLESELFGHEKGAFTGAISTRKGRFELAEGGTLFLDEIGDMPFPMQVKLLRVIQEKTFERVGGTKTMTSDVRLIAATHQDLEKKIGEGKFRMDLYYRLNVFPIELDPLRKRPEDIPGLVKEFSLRMETEHKAPIEFDESAITALQNNSLPGNVREIENLVERLAILYPGETITYEKLPQRYQIHNTAMTADHVDLIVDTEQVQTVQPASDISEVKDLKNYLTNLEKSIIEQALQESDWVVAKAAKALSVQRTTLVEKIRKLEISQQAS